MFFAFSCGVSVVLNYEMILSVYEISVDRKTYLVTTFFFCPLLNGAPSFAEISIWCINLTVSMPGPLLLSCVMISYGEFRLNINNSYYISTNSFAIVTITPRYCSVSVHRESCLTGEHSSPTGQPSLTSTPRLHLDPNRSSLGGNKAACRGWRGSKTHPHPGTKTTRLGAVIRIPESMAYRDLGDLGTVFQHSLSLAFWLSPGACRD